MSASHLLAHFKGGETDAQRSLSQLALLFPLHQTPEIPLDTQTGRSPSRKGLDVRVGVDGTRQKRDCGPRILTPLCLCQEQAEPAT